jgi:eukaryotic-like serine/threonine-protein kinase
MGLNLFDRFRKNADPDRPLGGRYRIVDKLGSGGFSQTFLAQDLHLPGQPRCVVKQLQPQVNDANSLQTARRLFDTEAQVLYRLGTHNQIPRLLAHFEDDQEFYLVQELIDGDPLTKTLVAGQAWTETQVVSLLSDLLHVLAFVHQENVIHRDIKPSNLIRRRQDGKIVLIDFGAVKRVSTQITNPNANPTQTIAIGTQGYMPNEQLCGNPRFSSDVYAVGMLAVQALTGVHPRHLEVDPDTYEMNWRDRLPGAKGGTPQIDPGLAQVIDRMILYDFRVRYPTAVEALNALQMLEIAAAQPLPSVTEPNEPSNIAQLQTQTLPLEEMVAASGQMAIEETAPPPPPSTQFRAGINSNTPTEPIGSQIPSSLRKANPVHHSAPVTLPSGDRPSQLQATPTRMDLASSRSWLLPAGIGVVAVIAVVSLFGIIPALFSSSDRSPEEVTTSVPSSSTSSETQQPDRNAEAQLVMSLNQANTLRQQEQYDQALQAYDQALALKADSVEAHWGRCYSLNRLQRLPEAIAACDAALAINPNDAQALWSKGYALEQQQNYQAALQLYNQAIAQNADFAEVWNNKGTSLLFLSRPDEAVAAFDQAIKLNPDFAEAWNNRGAALWSLQRFDEAIASIDKAIEIDPNYTDAKNLRQQIREKLGR